jgi:hypothetical protein
MYSKSVSLLCGHVHFQVCMVYYGVLWCVMLCYGVAVWLLRPKLTPFCCYRCFSFVFCISVFVLCLCICCSPAVGFRVMQLAREETTTKLDYYYYYYYYYYCLNSNAVSSRPFCHKLRHLINSNFAQEMFPNKVNSSKSALSFG